MGSQHEETAMKRHLAMLAAVLVVGATVATTAVARDSFAISIGAPGFGVGYANGGYGYAYVAPPVVASPPAAYYGAPYPYAYPRVVYGPRYYGPYWRYRYWHRY
jgi:hypothetical protein